VGLVLGDMRELGEFSASLHRELAEAVVALGPRFVISVGYESRVIHEVACHGGIDAVHAPSAERAAEEANERLESWSILFVKASRGVGLDRTVAQLLMHAQRDEQSTTIEDQTNS
jgi:UDP-N-acetylmuramoyl-tripeptide--D-alanyl-D-alanine ligase